MIPTSLIIGFMVAVFAMVTLVIGEKAGYYRGVRDGARIRKSGVTVPIMPEIVEEAFSIRDWVDESGAIIEPGIIPPKTDTRLDGIGAEIHSGLDLDHGDTPIDLGIGKAIDFNADHDV